MATRSRQLAWTVLRDLRPGGRVLADRLAREDVASLDPRDRAFLHELVLGTLRARGRLDHALASACERPLAEVDPGVLDLLRLGAYQLLDLRVPDRAAVSESVELARTAAPQAGGFVNAVLRRLAREGPPPLPDEEQDPAGWLTTAGSLPPWLAGRWLRELGPAAAVARARAFLEPAPTVVRLNPRVPQALDILREAGLDPRPTPVPGAWRVDRLPHHLAEAGVAAAQDLGSQLVAHLAAAPGRVLDACAAPGGKALLIADASGPAVTVTALEASGRRCRTLAALVRRWGAPNVHVVRADATRPPVGGGWDAVLIDAPCSGLGTLGRHPDARWRVQEGDLPRHGRRQAGLLVALAPLVRPGGRLVYSTCSLEPEETVGVVAPFLQASPAFRPEAPPDWAASYREEEECLRVRPERHGGDGFFAVRLRRAEEGPSPPDVVGSTCVPRGRRGRGQH